MNTIPAQLSLLTVVERQALSYYESRMEQAVDQHEAASIVFATGLWEIHRQGLYKDYGTFDDYCRERWQKRRRWGYQLIDAAKVIENVRHGAHILPANERQIRPLVHLEPDRQAEAWRIVEETAPEGGITAAHVEHVVMELKATSAPINRLAVHQSSDSQEWYTPRTIIDLVTGFFDEIDLDPCSNSHDAPNVPARTHYTQADDGLIQPWFGRVYLNPPYGRVIDAWVNKLCCSYEALEVEAGIALLPARTDTDWFQRLTPYPVCFIDGRLTFVGATAGAPFPSVLVYLGDEVQRFAQACQSLGVVRVVLRPS